MLPRREHAPAGRSSSHSPALPVYCAGDQDNSRRATYLKYRTTPASSNAAPITTSSQTRNPNANASNAVGVGRIQFGLLVSLPKSFCIELENFRAYGEQQNEPAAQHESFGPLLDHRSSSARD
jgi:hypothetical protein